MSHINSSSELPMGLSLFDKQLVSTPKNSKVRSSFYQELTDANSSEKATNNEYLAQGIQQLGNTLDVRDNSFLSELTDLSFGLSGISIQSIETLQLQLSQDSLIFWVPLTSIALGKLEQTQKNVTYSLLGDTQQKSAPFDSAQLKANIALSNSYSLEVNQQIDKSYIKGSTSTDMLRQNQFAKQKELQRLNSSQYVALESQNNLNWLRKRLTFLKNDEGVTLLYRDYKENSLTIEKQLFEMKKFIERKLVVKQIIFNGKLLLSGDETISGETYAS